jgi:cytidylate kinase
MIIALTGYARSGKDTACDMLQNNYNPNYIKISFATTIYNMLATMLGTSVEVINDMKVTGGVIPGTDCTIRKALQTLGTEWGRELIDEDIWAKTLINKVRQIDEEYGHVNICISDLRFINEVRVLKQYEEDTGNIVKIVGIRRHSEQPQTFHASEMDIQTIFDKYCDTIINNDGDFHFLDTKLKDLLEI